MTEAKPPAVETFRRNVSSAATADQTPRFRGYRTPSTRLSRWDYAGDGYYFVTICTRGKEPFFGEVIDGRVTLSPMGRIVEEEWRRTALVRSYVTVDEFVVMPNHVHGILAIRDRHPAVRGAPAVETFRRNVSTAGPPRLIAGSLGAIIGQFKSVCTKRIRADGFFEFAWQPRFYDHIIRDEPSLDRIRQYIADNPRKWSPNEDTPENLWM